MPSIAELRTWLLDCATELTELERRLSRSSAEQTPLLRALSVRLALISQILTAQRAGVALESSEQQLFELMLRAQLDRLHQTVHAMRPPTEQEQQLSDYLEGFGPMPDAAPPSAGA